MIKGKRFYREVITGMDTEVTGIDLRYSARPFMVSFGHRDGSNDLFVWDVDPSTRKVLAKRQDLEKIQRIIDETDTLVIQNSKFDQPAIDLLFQDHRMKLRWDWSKVRDTLYDAHLLASHQPKDLTTLCIVYLKINISKWEDDLIQALAEARQWAKSEFPKWRISQQGLPEMPSAKERLHKFDMWLPRAIAKAKKLPKDHPWWNITSLYCNIDSGVLPALHLAQKKIIEERGLEKISAERHKILGVVPQMESNGMTFSKKRIMELVNTYTATRSDCERICVRISKGKLENLPKSGASNALRETIFNQLKFPIVTVTAPSTKFPNGQPSVDKDTLDEWIARFEGDPSRQKSHEFVCRLKDSRACGTSLTFLESYLHYGRQRNKKFRVFLNLWPTFNPVTDGSKALRWNSENPNAQQVSKREGFNLRYAFGPTPDREWWSLDYQNLELRLPSYESGEKDLIYLFENPDDAPYYGSNHLMIFHLLHPEKWNAACKEVGEDNAGPFCKKKYAATWYQWTKNAGFSLQYGAQKLKVDTTAHVPGAYEKIQSRLGKMTKLNKRWIDYANKYGYIETMPDREVDPDHGYPIWCKRSWGNRVVPTTPLNYHIQGTACWVLMRAMVEIHEKLESWGPNYKMIATIHDELIFDFPRKPNKGNLPKIKSIARAMRQKGDCVGVPLTVGTEYICDNWSNGETVKW